MTTASERIAEVIARCQARAEEPAFRANAARLAAESQEAAEVLAASELRHARLRSGVPIGLWDPVHPDASPLEHPRETAALVAVKAHVAAPRACVFLTLAGSRGQGKTFAAAWAVYSAGGRFVDAHDLVRLSSFDANEWRDLEHQPVLALDELGAEYVNEAYRANLYALLNRRYADQRRTVLVTNLSPSAFLARYCPTADDRLLERLTTGGTWVNLAGESMRTHWQDEPGSEG